MKLGVIILNYRTAGQTVACLESVCMQDEVTLRAVVVDNGSGDESAQTIAAFIEKMKWGNWASVLPLEKNGGFAFGNNRGIETVGEVDYVVLLNSDTRLHDGCLKKCLAIMEADKGIGVMSGMLVGQDGSVQNAARKFPTPMRAMVSSLGLPWKWPRRFGWGDIQDWGWDRRTVRRDVDWLCGAFLFIRAAAMKQTGLLDEDFFFYGEDIEFCHRMGKSGFRCWYDPSAVITHIGGASGVADARGLRSRADWLVQRKCYGLGAAVLVGAVGRIAAGLRRRKGKK